jgi:hypothetical protein
MNPHAANVSEAKIGVGIQEKRMPIVLYLGSDIKDYEEKSNSIIKQGVDEGRFRCTQCLESMTVHSHYERGIKETGERITITIVWCERCGEYHALLPDFLLPHKHYSGNEVEYVIIEGATEPVKLIDTAASESTVRRWLKQLGERIVQAVGILKILFGQNGHAASEVIIDPGSPYSELEQVLEMAPYGIRCSGNKLGMANIWLGTNGVPAFI